MKVALFGGTFDPIHTAHLRMARMLADTLSLDQVLFMPAFVPPHKVKSGIAPASDRLQMCRLATADDPRFQVSSLEIDRKGASFTVDTLEQLRALRPEDEWYLLIGADMFMTFGSWYRFQDIMELCTVCTVPRDDVTADTLRRHAETLWGDRNGYIVLDTPVGEISSTLIRDRIVQGEPFTDLVPEKVAAYIKQKDLYLQSSTVRLQDMEPQFLEIIRKRETDYRFLHSLEVAKSAEQLAKRYGADADKARVAGILHDVLKDVSSVEQLQIFEDFDILLDDVEKAAQKLWHAKAGAVFLEHILHIEDKELVDAVRYHTTARAGMSLLEKVLYVADFISADRTYPDVDVMREKAERSLEEAMEYALQYTVNDLEKKGMLVHPDTLAALREIEMGGYENGKR